MSQRDILHVLHRGGRQTEVFISCVLITKKLDMKPTSPLVGILFYLASYSINFTYHMTNTVALSSNILRIRSIYQLSILTFAFVFVTIIAIFALSNNPQFENRNILPAAAASLPQPFTLNTPTFSCVNGAPQVDLSWTTSVNAVSYTISRLSPGGTGWPQIATGITPTSYSSTAFPAGTGTYQYQVRAVSARGGEKYSNVQSVAVTPCPSAASVSAISVAKVISPTPIVAPAPAPTILATTIATPTASVGGNLIQNSAFEIDSNTDGVPDQWSKGAWGTNNRVFSYPQSSSDGTRAVSITMSGYVSGDAKWTCNSVAVTPGVSYRFSDQYLSTAATQVVIEYTSSAGVNSYIKLASLASSASTWKTYSGTFTVPAGFTSLRIFHLIAGNGVLTIDNLSLVNATAAVTTTSVTPPPPAPVPTPTPTPSPVVVAPAPQPAPTTSITLSSTKPLWGAYVGWQEQNMADFESRVGKTADLRAVFVHWGNESQFPMYLAPYIRDKGKTMVIFWEATDYNVASTEQPRFNYDSIIRGDWDNYFRSFAAGAKTYNAPVILIPFSEMNGDWFSVSGTKNGNSPAKHNAAYQHVREFFRTTTNVKFGWAPNNGSVPDIAGNQMADYYPGDAYVDIVGVDGFNFGGAQWETFAQVFDKALLQLSTYKKPIYLFSFASQADTRKSAWITDAISVQIPKHPEIKGWIWFNEQKERNWLVWSDLNSLAAFKTAIQ